MKFYETYLFIFRRGLRKVKLAGSESVECLQDQINLLSERLDALETPTEPSEPEVPEDVPTPMPPVVPVPPMVPDEPAMDEPEEPQPEEPTEPAPDVPEEEPVDPVEEPEAPEEPETPENPPTEEPNEPVEPETPEDTPTEPEPPSEPETPTPQPQGLRWTKVDRGEAVTWRYVDSGNPTGFSSADVRQTVLNQLNKIQDVCGITFEETPNSESDIDFNWTELDSRGNVLAQVYLPTRGNSIEACEVCGDVMTDLDDFSNLRTLDDLANVTLHELSHSMGLSEHSNNSDSVTYFAYSFGQPERELDAETIERFVERYPV